MLGIVYFMFAKVMNVERCFSCKVKLANSIFAKDIIFSQNGTRFLDIC